MEKGEGRRGKGEGEFKIQNANVKIGSAELRFAPVQNQAIGKRH